MKPHTICIGALHEIVSTLPLATRVALKNHIEVLQKELGDKTDLIVDRRGSHWAEKKVKVEIRGQGAIELTYKEACSQIHRTKKQLQMALSLGRGRASFTVGDEVFTVTK